MAVLLFLLSKLTSAKRAIKLANFNVPFMLSADHQTPQLRLNFSSSYLLFKSLRELRFSNRNLDYVVLAPLSVERPLLKDILAELLSFSLLHHINALN